MEYDFHLHNINCRGSKQYALLSLYVDKNDHELYQYYKFQCDAHNYAMSIEMFPNSGFDIFFPESVFFNTPFENRYVDFNIRGEMYIIDIEAQTKIPTGYYIYPRSSISKTPLMLSNHTGIIDSGYRGNLIGAFRYLPTNQNTAYNVEQYTRLLQICAPTLCPIFVRLVDADDFVDTTRGCGGFGSTGI